MKLTCVTAVYNAIKSGNRERLIRCVESVAALNTEHEHLIYDGASTDGTVDLICELATKIPELKVLSEPDTGIYNALNKGVRDAKGEWFYVLGCDDFIAKPEVMERIIEQADADTDVVATSVMIKDATGDAILFSDLKDLRYVFLKSVCCHQGEIARTKMVRNLCGFDEHYIIAADTNMFLSARITGYKFQYILEHFASYTTGGTSNVYADIGYRENLECVQNCLRLNRRQSVFYREHLFLPLTVSFRYLMAQDEALRRGARYMVGRWMYYHLRLLALPILPVLRVLRKIKRATV